MPLLWRGKNAAEGGTILHAIVKIRSYLGSCKPVAGTFVSLLSMRTPGSCHPQVLFRLVRRVPYMGGQTETARTKHKPAWLPQRKANGKRRQASRG
eukprot:149119-Pelagomonas_calceolata.AAC.3